MSKIYHIYAGNECILHSIPEEEFKITWKTLNHMIGIMHTTYNKEDLSYEELIINQEMILNSSH